MDSIQEKMNEWLHDFPRQIVGEMVNQKLREQKIRSSKKRLKDVVACLLTEMGELLNLDDGRKAQKTISFTEEDVNALDKRIEEFLQKLPSIIEATSDQFAGRIL